MCAALPRDQVLRCWLWGCCYATLLLCSVLVEQSPESREQLAWAVGWNQCIFLAPAFLVPAAAYLLTYIHTYIHTYILTYILTYIHT